MLSLLNNDSVIIKRPSGFPGRPVPQPLLAVFAALGEPGGEAGNHVPHLLRAAAALALAECRRPAPPAGKAVSFGRTKFSPWA